MMPISWPCKTCGCDVGGTWRKKYCSPACYPSATKEYRSCQTCGALFQGAQGKKYCSLSCRSSYKARVLPHGEERSCAKCGNVFTVDHYKRIYCSARCRVTAGHAAKRIKTKLIKICENCKRPFETNKERQRNCSNDCYRQWQKDYDRKRNKAKYVPVPGNRQCISCGNEFTALHGNKLVCSTDCARQHRNALRSMNEQIRILERPEEETRAKRTRVKKREQKRRSMFRLKVSAKAADQIINEFKELFGI